MTRVGFRRNYVAMVNVFTGRVAQERLKRMLGLRQAVVEFCYSLRLDSNSQGERKRRAGILSRSLRTTDRDLKKGFLMRQFHVMYPGIYRSLWLVVSPLLRASRSSCDDFAFLSSVTPSCQAPMACVSLRQLRSCWDGRGCRPTQCRMRSLPSDVEHVGDKARVQSARQETGNTTLNRTPVLGPALVGVSTIFSFAAGPQEGSIWVTVQLRSRQLYRCVSGYAPTRRMSILPRKYMRHTVFFVPVEG